MKIGMLGCLTLFGLSSCDNNNKTAEDMDDETTMEEGMMTDDATSMTNATTGDNDIYYPNMIDAKELPATGEYYRYGYVREDNTVEPIAKRDATADAEARKVTRRDDTYGKDDVDMMPLFKADCKMAKNPEKCNNDAIANYIKENLKYPDNAEQTGKEGVENIVFVINAMGEVEGDVRAIRRDSDACDACAQAAVSTVRNMPTWAPAMRDGKAVKVRMILPVRFELIGQGIR